jgi:hypothetical protein
MGIFQGIIYVWLWLIFGICAIFCISQTFPNVWIYILWLIAIYIFAVLGWIAIFILRTASWLALGLLSEAFAYGIAAYLIWHIKELRDNMPRYVPLGLWTLAVIAFWLCANGTIYGWALWAIDHAGLHTYIFFELLIIALAIYILWLPQANFEWEPLPTLSTRLRRIVHKELKLSLKRTGKRLHKLKRSLSWRRPPVSRCPLCDANLITETRTCPDCGNSREFKWCVKSEEYIISCPYCKQPTLYGRPECGYCNKPLSKKIKCSCGKSNLLKDMVRQDKQ